MSLEPEHPLDEVLRAAAAKRQQEAGAPFELHPATRRMLHGEVSRQFAKSQPDSGTSSRGFIRLWPRFAWGLGAVAILALAAFLLSPGTNTNQHGIQLAQNTPTSSPTPEPAGVAAPTPATALPAAETEVGSAQNAQVANATTDGLTREKQKEVAKAAIDASFASTNALLSLQGGALAPNSNAARTDQVLLFADKDSAASGLTSVATNLFSFNSPAKPESSAGAPGMVARNEAQSLTESLISQSSQALRDKSADRSFSPTVDSELALKKAASAAPPLVAESRQLAVNKPDSVGAAPSAKLESKSKVENPITQSYSRVAPFGETKSRSANPAPTNPLLGSFRLEQTGHDIRIVDWDGSVYTGALAPSLDEAEGRARMAERMGIAQGAKATLAGSANRKVTTLESIGTQSGQSNFFRVSGTSRTLRKPIVFSGSLMAPATELVDGNANSFTNFAATQTNRTVPLNLPGARIAGRAIINGRQEIEINAVPAK
jgi:hypothetical protein